MARKIWVQSQVESYQRLKKWYLMPTCLTLSIIRYGSREKWRNPGKGVAPSQKTWCRSYRKGSLRVTLDYGRQLYLLIYIYIYIYIYILHEVSLRTCTDILDIYSLSALYKRHSLHGEWVREQDEDLIQINWSGRQLKHIISCVELYPKRTHPTSLNAPSVVALNNFFSWQILRWNAVTYILETANLPLIKNTCLFIYFKIK